MAAACQGRNRSRDELLIYTLFQTGIRISEALSLTPRPIGTNEGEAALHILGKGGKSRLVGCPDSLAHRLKSFALERIPGHIGQILDMKFISEDLWKARNS